MTERVECVVIGAGVIGLAVARALALSGREVWVLEAAEGIGTGASSRNSEVIHAGIYYPTGSLKARFCVEGKAMLYEYCLERGIPHSRLGKLIVAADEEEVPVLTGIKRKAAENGVGDLEFMSGDEALSVEPALRVAGALFSPSTGIIDSHALMLAYQGDTENAGGAVVFHAPVLGGSVQPGGGFVLRIGGGWRWSSSASCSSTRSACMRPMWRAGSTASRPRAFRRNICARAAIIRCSGGRRSSI